MLVLKHTAAPVVQLVAQRMGFSVLKYFLVNRECPVTLEERLIDGLEKSYLDDFGSGTLPSHPAHVIEAGDDAETLPNLEGIRRPIEHAIDVIDDHEACLQPPLELRE